MAIAKGMDLRLYLTREPVILALLSVLAVVSFLGVTGLSRAYRAQQESLGNRWFSRGVADLKAKQFDRAVVEFRTALLYSRDNYSYQLNLAEALLGLKRTSEAYAYLANLWDREPEDGLVNLELARIAVQRQETDQALRYYHNAIYAAWPEDEELRRRDARLELVEFLLSNNAGAQAQAELIALEVNLGEEDELQARVGDLFMRVQDYSHALEAYRLSLKSDRHNGSALAGAGRATFEMGQYPQAENYLRGAVAANPGDAQSEEHLKTAEMVLQMDPFQRQLSTAQRHRIVVNAFAAAGERLKACRTSGFAPGQNLQARLADAWMQMKPQITEAGLRENPDMVEKAMELVFSIERQTATSCGAPAGADLALLMIAKMHEGS